MVFGWARPYLPLPGCASRTQISQLLGFHTWLGLGLGLGLAPRSLTLARDPHLYVRVSIAMVSIQS